MGFYTTWQQRTHGKISRDFINKKQPFLDGTAKSSRAALLDLLWPY